MLRVLITCGGSGGHIAPAISVWQALKTLEPNGMFLFLCTPRESDAQFLQKHSASFREFPEPHHSLKGVLDFFMALRSSIHVIRTFRPDVVFCKGGVVSIAPAIVARFYGIPVVLHESDVVMGRANRFLIQLATYVCLGWNETQHHLRPWNKQKYHVTGNPIRTSVAQGSRERGFAKTGFSGKKPVLLVQGGSQGSVAINEAVCSLLQKILVRFDVVHLTGIGKIGCTPNEGYFTQPFAYEDLPHLYAIATLAVSRGGAGSIAELAANGIPTVFVPLRGLAQDHQQRNVECASQYEGCVIIQQEDLIKKLLYALDHFCKTPENYQMYRKKMQSLASPTADRQIAEIILKSVAKPGSTA